MNKTTPTIDELINTNPKVNADKIKELTELAEKLKNIPTGVQRAPSSTMRRRIDLDESDDSDRRTVYLTRRR